jgi:uncharacterized protein (TIGR02284 family)
MDNKNQISTLNTLLATTIDSVKGYEDSAQNIDSEQLRQIFRQNADERQQVVGALREEVRRLGGDPEESGSFMGAAHQRFEDLKAAITGRDEKAIVNEVERGEDYIKGKFETALESGDLTGDSRSTVEQCYQTVRRGHDQISQLKHGMESPA